MTDTKKKTTKKTEVKEKPLSKINLSLNMSWGPVEYMGLKNPEAAAEIIEKAKRKWPNNQVKYSLIDDKRQPIKHEASMIAIADALPSIELDDKDLQSPDAMGPSKEG